MMENKKCHASGEKTPKDFTKSVCKGCGQYIEWIKTENGKNMPVNPLPVTVVTDDGKTITGRTPHWATCEKASQFKKKIS